MLNECIRDRFEQSEQEMYATLEKLLINTAVGKPFDQELTKVVEFYRDDIKGDLLEVQLKTFPAVIGVLDEPLTCFGDLRKIVINLKSPLEVLSMK